MSELLGDVVQHLLHGGFTIDEVCNLVPGPTAAQVQAAFEAAETRRPKLCKQRCTQMPSCPYCSALLRAALRGL
jgi:hypothetical protein